MTTPSDHDETEPADPSGRNGRVERLRARFEPQVERGLGWYEALRARSVAVDLAHRAWSRFTAINGSILAGFLAYRIFLLLLPLAVIVVALAGYSMASTSGVSQHLKLGSTLTNAVAQAGQEAGKGRTALLLTGLVAFTITAWGLLSGLQYVSAQVWSLRTRRFPGKTRSFVRLAGSLLLFGAVLYVSALIRNAGFVAGLAGSLTTLASTFVGFFGLGWILPRRSKEWFWLLPGACVGAGGQVLMQLIGTHYLTHLLSNASETYGAIGTVVAVLSYLYLFGVLLVIAPAVNAVVWERFEDDPPGIFRRIADRIPIPATTFGSGYVEEGGAVETVDPYLRP